MEFVQTTAELMGLTSLLTAPMLLLAIGGVGFILSGAAARTIEGCCQFASRRAVRRARPSVDVPHYRPSLGVATHAGSVAEPVGIAS